MIEYSAPMVSYPHPRLHRCTFRSRNSYGPGELTRTRRLPSRSRISILTFAEASVEGVPGPPQAAGRSAK